MCPDNNLLTNMIACSFIDRKGDEDHASQQLATLKHAIFLLRKNQRQTRRILFLQLRRNSQEMTPMMENSWRITCYKDFKKKNNTLVS